MLSSSLILRTRAPRKLITSLAPKVGDRSLRRSKCGRRTGPHFLSLSFLRSKNDGTLSAIQSYYVSGYSWNRTSSPAASWLSLCWIPGDNVKLARRGAGFPSETDLRMQGTGESPCDNCEAQAGAVLQWTLRALWWRVGPDSPAGYPAEELLLAYHVQPALLCEMRGQLSQCAPDIPFPGWPETPPSELPS